MSPDQMKFAVIDTETSGLMDFKRPADDPDQPRVASFAMILLDGIHGEPREFGFLIKPDGWELSAEAAEVNGLTMGMLESRGQPVSMALDIYQRAILDGYHVVAYGAQFDCKMMRAEFRRAGRDDLFEQTPNICLMRACMSGLKGLRAPGMKGWPKLAEACGVLNVEHEGAHTAMGDARAALGVLRALYARNALPVATVHYAKEAPAGKAATE